MLEGIRHGFYTRVGGVSTGVYSSLNCGFGSDDERANVAENRRLIAHDLFDGELIESVNSSPSPLIMTPYQHHSADAVIVNGPWQPADAPKADAVVTNKPGLVIGILTADCAPVLFADPVAHVVGAAHAGWRGAVGGVLEATIEAMEQLGAVRERLTAVVGPTISLENYEVGPEFKADFLSKNPEYSAFFSELAAGERPHFDLPNFAKHRLIAAGIGTADAISHCTYGDESLFFSYRRNCHQNIADYGRHISAIGLN